MAAETNILSQEDLDWLNSRGDDWQTVRCDYVNNIPLPIKKRYEEIYQRYLDARFIMDMNCSACVFNTLKRLLNWFDGKMAELQQATPAPALISEPPGTDNPGKDNTSKGGKKA